METITNREARQILINAKNKIFTVDFVKRSNGEVRTMNCRRGVKKGLNGNGQRYDALSKGLLPVFDMQAHDYRVIALESILRLSIRGKSYIVNSLSS